MKMLSLEFADFFMEIKSFSGNDCVIHMFAIVSFNCYPLSAGFLETFNTWCTPKSHTYVNKPAIECFRCFIIMYDLFVVTRP